EAAAGVQRPASRGSRPSPAQRLRVACETPDLRAASRRVMTSPSAIGRGYPRPQPLDAGGVAPGVDAKVRVAALKAATPLLIPQNNPNAETNLTGKGTPMQPRNPRST